MPGGVGPEFLTPAETVLTASLVSPVPVWKTQIKSLASTCPDLGHGRHMAANQQMNTCLFPGLALVTLQKTLPG